MRNSGTALLGFVLTLASSLRGGGWVSWSLIWGEGRWESRGQAGGVAWVVGLGWSVLGGAVCRMHAQDSAFTPSPSEVAVEILVFLFFFFIICPNWACMQLLLFYSFFVFCCWRCLSKCRHYSKGAPVLHSSLSHLGCCRKESPCLKGFPY